MATLSENLYDALGGSTTKGTKKGLKIDSQPEEAPVILSNPETYQNNDESIWTVQSSTKRRLAPQYVLSKNDLGVDSPKNRASQQEVTKKKGKVNTI